MPKGHLPLAGLTLAATTRAAAESEDDMDITTTRGDHTMISTNAHVWASHVGVTLTPVRPPHLPLQHPLPGARRTRATSWWGMTLLGAGLLGGWVAIGVGWGVFLDLLYLLLKIL